MKNFRRRFSCLGCKPLYLFPACVLSGLCVPESAWSWPWENPLYRQGLRTGRQRGARAGSPGSAGSQGTRPVEPAARVRSAMAVATERRKRPGRRAEGAGSGLVIRAPGPRRAVVGFLAAEGPLLEPALVIKRTDASGAAVQETARRQHCEGVDPPTRGIQRRPPVRDGFVADIDEPRGQAGIPCGDPAPPWTCPPPGGRCWLAGPSFRCCSYRR